MCFPKIYPDRLLENFYGKSQNPTNGENIRESLFTLIQVPTLPTKKIQWYRHIWCVAKNMMFFLTDGPTFARWPWAFLFSLVSEKRKKASLWVTSHRCDVILEKVANPQVSQDIMPNAYLCHTVPTFHFCPKIICQFCSILYLLSRTKDWNFQSCFQIQCIVYYCTIISNDLIVGGMNNEILLPRIYSWILCVPILVSVPLDS